METILTEQEFVKLVDWIENHSLEDKEILYSIYTRFATDCGEEMILYRGIKNPSENYFGKNRPYSFSTNKEIAKYFAKVDNEYEDVGTLQNVETSLVVKVRAFKCLDLYALLEQSPYYGKYKRRLYGTQGEKEILVHPFHLVPLQETYYVKINNKMVERI